MDIVKNFGLDPVLLAAQVINFLLVLFILRRFLYKPVLTLLQTRKEMIAQGLKQTEEAQLLLEKTKQEEKAVLKKAQTQAKELLAQAKDQAALLAKAAEESSKKHSEKILAQAHEQILRETKEAEARIMKNVSRMAIDFLQKGLSELVSEKDQTEIMERAMKELQKKPN